MMQTRYYPLHRERILTSNTAGSIPSWSLRLLNLPSCFPCWFFCSGQWSSTCTLCSGPFPSSLVVNYAACTAKAQFSATYNWAAHHFKKDVIPLSIQYIVLNLTVPKLNSWRAYYSFFRNWLPVICNSQSPHLQTSTHVDCFHLVFLSAFTFLVSVGIAWKCTMWWS